MKSQPQTFKSSLEWLEHLEQRVAALNRRISPIEPKLEPLAPVWAQSIKPNLKTAETVSE